MCICTIRRIDVIDEITVTVFCPIHGTEHFHKEDHGKWESGTARMKRMERTHTCSGCGKKFHDFREDFKTERELCNSCVEKSDRAAVNGYRLRNAPHQRRGASQDWFL